MLIGGFVHLLFGRMQRPRKSGAPRANRQPSLGAETASTYRIPYSLRTKIWNFGSLDGPQGRWVGGRTRASAPVVRLIKSSEGSCAGARTPVAKKSVFLYNIFKAKYE